MSELNVHIRWCIRRDMPEVLAIENDVFEFPWSEDDFIRCLRNVNCIGMVAEHDDQILGAMVYELEKSYLRLLNFSVRRDCWGRGVGRQMIGKLIGKLSSQRRTRIVTETRERNLAAQMFFKACGFRATNVFPKFYEDCNEDAYQFVYRYKPQQFVPVNRIAKYHGAMR